MIEHITVSRDSKDGLTNWKWRFWYDSHALWLDYYCEFQRPTRRHGFRPAHSYSALDPRGHDMTESDVVLPADVIKETTEAFCKGITVRRRSERSNNANS